MPSNTLTVSLAAEGTTEQPVEFVLNDGITEITVDTPSESVQWIVPLSSLGAVQLIPIGPKKAHVFLATPGYWEAIVVAVKDSKIATTTLILRKLGEKLDTASLRSKVWAKLKSVTAVAVKGVWAYGKKIVPYVLLVALGFGLNAGLKNGCSLPDWVKPDNPTPIPVGDVRIAVVYESEDTLTLKQKSAIDGKALDDFVKAKAKEMRLLDKDVTFSDSVKDKLWIDAKAFATPPLPVVVVLRGTTPAIQSPIVDDVQLLDFLNKNVK